MNNIFSHSPDYTCFVLYRSDLRLSCNDGVFWWRNGEAVRPSAISGFTRYDLSSQMLKISDIRGNNPEVNYTCGRSPEAISDTFTVKVRGELCRAKLYYSSYTASHSEYTVRGEL